MANELSTVRRLIADDAHALTFQTFGQYRTALLKAIDALPPVAGEAVAQSAPTEAGGVLAHAINAASAWIAHAPHGDNCYVSDHYEGDPGSGCNCGKENVEDVLCRAEIALNNPGCPQPELCGAKECEFCRDTALSTLPAPSPEAVAGAIDARGQEANSIDCPACRISDEATFYNNCQECQERRLEVVFHQKRSRPSSALASRDQQVDKTENVQGSLVDKSAKLQGLASPDAGAGAPMCRDCADFGPICPNSGKPCAAPASAPEAPEQQGEAVTVAEQEAVKWLNSWFRNHDGNKIADALSAALAQAAPATGKVGAVARPITASVMVDDGGDKPVYCLMAAYRDKPDAMSALSALTATPVQAETGEARAAMLQGVEALLNEAYAHWDADREYKVGKILLALIGFNKGYDKRADEFRASLKAAQPDQGGAHG